MADRQAATPLNADSTAPQAFANVVYLFDDVSVRIDGSEIAHGFSPFRQN
jgi:hypothetical protein